MAAVQVLSISTPPIPAGYSIPGSSSSARISDPHPSGHRTLLPVGPAYVNHLRLSRHHSHSFSSLDNYIAAEKERIARFNAGEFVAEDDLGVGEEEETQELLSLDPKEWKKQDHYAVLGLSHLRYKATAEQIKIAHRKKVLKHHPDKKAGNAPPVSNSLYLAGVNQNTNDDAFFKCIQKAHEVLTNTEKRRQFDSVDPDFLDFEERIPHAGDFKSNKLNFFKALAPAFDAYSRFSKIQPVPGLGHVNSTKEDVEGFYNFWYNFDSWRSFEWYDKEVNEGSDNRDDKRYTEKKNKSERARRKKEDIAKLRSLVDMTLALDPRIKRIKQEEKEAREAKKRGLANGSVKKTKAQEEEEKRKAELEAKQQEEAEKVARAETKKQKAAAANAAKKARRQQRAAEEAAAHAS